MTLLLDTHVWLWTLTAQERIQATGVTPIAIEHVHALAAGRLPTHHHDPFDRNLVAQARHLDVPVVTADPLIRAYDVAVPWVGH